MRGSTEKVVISATEAAKMLGIQTNRMLEMLNKGEIPACRNGRNWKIPKDLLIKTFEEMAIREAFEKRKNVKDVK